MAKIMTNRSQYSNRYSNIAVLLHWVIAIAIAAMLISGATIHYKLLAEDRLFYLYQWHKSLGVVLLFAIVLRLLWRLSHRAPTLPTTDTSTSKTANTTAEQAAFSPQQLFAAKAGHWALYLLLLLMPISGWLLVSSSDVRIPTLVFQLFKWPHLPLPTEWNISTINYLASNLHYYGAIVLAVLLAGHIAMVIQHRRHGINLLERMPFNKSAIVAVSCFVLSLAILTALSLPNVTNRQSQSSESNASLNSASDQASNKTQQGEVNFSGSHTDNPFTGTFKQWTLHTKFNSETQQLSSFQLTIDTSSVDTGNNYYNASLSESDWFDSAQYPSLLFHSETITQISENTFAITGALTIKQLTQPLSFTVNLEANKLTTQFALSRLAHGLGVDSDPDAEWVDDLVTISAWAELEDKNL